MSRQVVLDTETTGLDVSKGHRVIEIGCIEMVERRPTGRRFHRYINPDREIDVGAIEVTGLTLDFLADKPRFDAVAEEFLDFIRDAELIIHNAAFDVGFLEHELGLCGASITRIDHCSRVIDTLAMARERYPGKRNSLDALCSRLDIDNAHRKQHGALLDAELMADVYLAMTTGQGDLMLAAADQAGHGSTTGGNLDGIVLVVRRATSEERAQHALAVQRLDDHSDGALWHRYVQFVDGTVPAGSPTAVAPVVAVVNSASAPAP